ncbi:MAG TPA: CTP synthase, partial [candidate division Zixibacteria bacterium]|nr:CTP synthase [candidate division Zixibacteria bacterium]
KYIDLKDAYKSIIEAFLHAGGANKAKVELVWIPSEKISENGPETYLADIDALLVPGGFGERGIEGKIEAVNFVRTHNIPFLGICLGLQCAVIDYARTACGLDEANSSEFAPETKHPVIHLMQEQESVTRKGGTMRLGSYPCRITRGTLAHKLYGALNINERHRHRYEVNNEYRKKLEECGLVCSGIYQEGNLVEIIELPNHPFFIAGQFHPELKSRPMRPHPLFVGLVAAAIIQKSVREEAKEDIEKTIKS